MSLNGIDIASHQGNINLAVVPCDFVIIKATGGDFYVNPYCDSRYQLAKKQGKKLGVYHYAHEGKVGDPIKEAEFFLKNIQGYLNDALLVLDYEEQYNTSTPDWCLRFLNHVYSKTGVKPLLYINSSTMNSYNWTGVVAGDYGLWLADYNYSPKYPTHMPNIKTPTVKWWKTLAIYQYASDGRLNGYDNNLDLNVFYGDKNTWDKYAKKKETGTLPTQPNDNIHIKKGDSFKVTNTSDKNITLEKQ